MPTSSSLQNGTMSASTSRLPPSGIPPRPPGVPSSSSAIPPNQTLYITNLNDKIHKPDLKIALYTLFSTYGIVLDVVALKTMKMRGQAHIAFRDIASASTAMRACQGMTFFGKEMRIQYAKSKSDTIAKLDGTYRMPSLRTGDENAGGAASTFAPLPGQKKNDDVSSGPGLAAAPPTGTTTEVHGTKRRRDESESEQSDVEMEVEDDSD